MIRERSNNHRVLSKPGGLIADRRDNGESIRGLARGYNVTPSTISRLTA
jgi:hypothetical protein